MVNELFKGKEWIPQIPPRHAANIAKDALLKELQEYSFVELGLSNPILLAQKEFVYLSLVLSRREEMMVTLGVYASQDGGPELDEEAEIINPDFAMEAIGHMDPLDTRVLLATPIRMLWYDTLCTLMENGRPELLAQSEMVIRDAYENITSGKIV